MAERPSIDRLASELNRQVLADAMSWAQHEPLKKLHVALTSHTTLKPFLDTWAEALVAHHLLSQGCTLRFEVTTPNGKACDFEVTTGDEVFFLHVKRLDTDRPARRRLTISSRLRALERIERPYVVSVRWHEGVRDRDMQRLVREASRFIQHARVGDEMVVHGDDGREIGGVLVVAPWEGSHVTLAIGLPSGFIDDAPRMRRLLSRGYQQFMPRQENVILVCSSDPQEQEDFQNAVLGTHVERWDTFPPRGRRVAHGRADDGFWHDNRHDASRLAGWFPFSTRVSSPQVKLLRREEPAPGAALAETIERVLGEPQSADARSA